MMKKTIRILLLLTALMLFSVSAAADGESVLTLPENLTVIEAEAFRSDTGIVRVDLPAGVTEIGAGAFRDCGSPTAELRYYFPPAGVAVGAGAFENCRAEIRLNGAEIPHLSYSVSSAGITITGISGQPSEVVIPDTIDGKPVIAIGNSAFRDKNQMTRVVIPATVTSIGVEAFRYCRSLSSVQLPASLTSLGERVFEDCDALTAIAFPAGITSLPSEAFARCIALTDIDLTGITSLGNSVFMYCQALTEITLPAGITALPSETFYGCTALESIDLTGITSLGNSVFRDCRSLTEVTVPEGITQLPTSAFEGAWGLLRVHLPETLTAIGNYAFNECRALTEVSIPSGITEIPNAAFRKCYALQQIRLPAGLATIAVNAFRECTALTQINFPAGLTAIGQEAFRDACVGQNANAIYVLPDSVTSFGSDAFYHCGAGLLVAKNSSLENVVRENGFTFAYDADDGFRYQYKKNGDVCTLYLTGYEGTATAVVIPQGPEAVGEGAFYENADITAVTIPAGVVTIENDAFTRCTNLQQVTMADTVTTVKDRVFLECANLTNVHFSANLTAIGSDTFRQACTVAGTYFYRLPDGIDTLGGNTFYGCGAVLCFNRGSSSATLFRTRQYIYTYTGETDFRYRWYSGEGGPDRLLQYTGTAAEVQIPAEVWLIDDNAFRDNASITKVTVPAGVTHIGSNAFRDCVNLTDISLPASLKELRDNSFYGCGSNAQTPFVFSLPDGIEGVHLNVFTNSPALLMCGVDTVTARTISNRGYSFIRPGRPDETDFRFRWDYFNHVLGCGLYDYAGTLTSVRLPDDCANVNRSVLGPKVNNGLELVCGQLSETAGALSRSEINFTFPGHEGLRYRIIDNALHVMGYTGTASTLVIPKASDYIAAEWEERIHADAFRNNTTLTKVVLPDGLMYVDDSAFRGCLNLTDITFPDSLRDFANHAFEQCGKNADTLHYYVLPDRMTGISTNVDAGWGAFTDINMGRIAAAPLSPDDPGSPSSTALQLSGIDTYNHGGSYYFAIKNHRTDGLLYRYDIRTVDGEQVNILVLKAYEGSATELAIPSGYGIYRIENNVFLNRNALTGVIIPSGVKEIGENAFNGCTVLHNGVETNVISIPAGVEKAGNFAFKDLGAGIKDRFCLVLPSSLSEFDINIFTGCNAVLVAPAGSPVAQRLYASDYYFYNTLTDAQNKQNLRFQPHFDEFGIQISNYPYKGRE